ncbi:helix-turn-helix transcriptional regulator [Margalitia sp. FSL K6-0131]|uniref:helix-turn-helix transcriptional regulator n=1 Tax=Margalitia sp. FSL K6-0131 TaxID=2954604 RepID=UPI004046D02B
MQESIGTKLRILRFSKNFTQKEVAEKLNITVKKLSDYENDRIKPNLELVKKLIKLYSC